MNIYDLISRAQKLRKETQLDSVSPDRVGGLHEDTLKYINEFQLLASSPSLHKAYASVSAMQSDKSPKSDLTGKPLKPGQLVVIVPANQTDATAGDVYRYDGPSGNTSAWTFVAKIGAVPADAELSATSTNPPQNKVVTEKLTKLESESNAEKSIMAESFNLIIPAYMTKNAFLTMTGSLAFVDGESEWRTSAFIPVRGKNIASNAEVRTGTNIATFAVYDDNFNFLRADNQTSNYLYQNGDAYVRFTFDAIPEPKANYGDKLSPLVMHSQYSDIVADVARLKANLLEFPKAKSNNGNIIPLDSFEVGFYYDFDDGIKTPLENWVCTGFIAIKANTLYSKSVTTQVCEYDADFNFIKSHLQANPTFETTDKTAYITATCISSKLDNARINEGEVLNPYIEGERLFEISQIKNLSESIDKIEGLEKISNDNAKILKDVLIPGIQLFNKDSEHIVKEQYCSYLDGIPTKNASYEWIDIPVVAGKAITTSGATNLHIAFLDNNNGYMSGLIVAWNEPTKTFIVPSGATIMRLSLKIEDDSKLMVEYGYMVSNYVPYREIINSEYLPPYKPEVRVKKGESILAALKSYSSNVRIIVESGVYDMVSEYKALYGADFFETYTGYVGHYDDLFYAGYYLADGVELIGEGDVTIRFDYDEGTKELDKSSPDFDAVAEYFAPINTSQNNVVKNINIVIGYEDSCRYHVHDDFARLPGNTIFQNMVLRGKSSKSTAFGCGMGVQNTYLLENIAILTGYGYSVSYHHNSGTGKNKLTIRNCYCEGNIMARMMGTSTEKTEVLVSGCHANAIVLNFVDQANQPNVNMELIQWNNEIIGG